MNKVSSIPLYNGHHAENLRFIICLGTAAVVFVEKVKALQAVQAYDGCLLDNKPLKIHLIEGSYILLQ